MPTSAWDGRRWVTDRLVDSTVETVVDVGPGEGTYSILGRHLIWWAEWVGVEVFEPYVERFLLGQKYDQIIVADILDWFAVPDDYLILFGDVLEHMEHDDAVWLLKRHMETASEVYVSVPIVPSPQGPCFGNDHETHLYDWTHQEMLDLLPGCEAFQGAQVGRYWWRREDD